MIFPSKQNLQLIPGFWPAMFDYHRATGLYIWIPGHCKVPINAFDVCITYCLNVYCIYIIHVYIWINIHMHIVCIYVYVYMPNYRNILEQFTWCTCRPCHLRPRLSPAAMFNGPVNSWNFNHRHLDKLTGSQQILSWGCKNHEFEQEGTAKPSMTELE